MMRVVIALALAPAIAWSPAVPRALAQGQPKRSPNIGYITPEIPPITVRPWSGTRYQALVPDTLDLAEMADLAINCLTRNPDPEADYEIYWYVDLARRPPSMMHDWQFVTIQPKFMEALPLVRLITGNEQNLEVDQRWAEVALHLQGPDGLIYTPTKGRPWARTAVWPPFPVPEGAEQFAVHYQCGRMMGAMTAFYLRDQDPVWRDAIERLIRRMTELAVDKGAYAYFPTRSFLPGERLSPDEPMPTGYPATIAAWSILGLSQFYRTAGYEPALTLAGKLAHFVIEHGNVYEPRGRFVPEVGGEFHHRTYPLLACLEYATLAKDREMQEFVRRTYEWARTAEGQANPLVGFIPGGFAPPGSNSISQSAEGCGIADMVALAVKLSAAQVGDYWDDVDRWVRNQFAEAQLRRADWLQNISPDKTITRELGPNETDRNVVQRNLGAFVPASGANEFTLGYYLVHCCAGNCIRAIYYVWEHILSSQDGKLRVNLLLNRASPWADVDSYIPYEGRVDIRVKQTCNLEVRIPEWVKPEEAACSVSGIVRDLTFAGRYAQVGAVGAGDLVVLTFPISERTVETSIGGKPYTLIIKGNDVVSIDPPGKLCPIYQRAHYRENQVRWVMRGRFVADDAINW